MCCHKYCIYIDCIYMSVQWCKEQVWHWHFIHISDRCVITYTNCNHRSVEWCKIQVLYTNLIRVYNRYFFNMPHTDCSYKSVAILIGCNKLLLSNTFPLTAAVCLKFWVVVQCAQPQECWTKSCITDTQSDSAFLRQKPECVANLKSQVQASQQENFKVYNSYYC